MTKLSVLASTAILAGCVLSIDAVVPESQATFDDRLLGSWEEVDGPDRAVVSRAGANAYTIEYIDGDGKAGRFAARLGRLGQRTILDVFPEPGDGELPAPYAELLVLGHMLIALDLEEDQVRLALLEPDTLLAALQAGEVPLTYSEGDDQLVLRDSTERLRATLAAYLERPGALGEPSLMRRAQGRAHERGAPAPAGPDPCFEPSAWREADRLFRRDPHWVGSDGAYSVDLGNGRTLWLFGDTWIDPSGEHTRRGARMVRNSLAIQEGADPSEAEMAFYWGEATEGGPGPFFPNRGNEWFWPGHGVRLDDRLLLFLMRVRGSGGGLGFESAGWDAVMVSNPDDAPSDWRVTYLDTPSNTLGVVVGSASVLRWDRHVYAFGSQEPVKSHPIYVVRWPSDEARRGNLGAPEWWAGPDIGWVPDSSPLARWPAFEHGQSEFTIHYDEAARRFLAVQSVGFGPADVAMRFAPDMTGPWTAPRMIFRPPEYYRPNVMIYAAKAHPQLAGADLVLTYATNTFEFSEQMTDSLIYYPRFVRLSRCR
ncbi:MAG: DUF4185 domain-containing protein [Gemmatimonadota bacterium]|nr:MAG: DUF4185 domain-containing protein [Gemmatimonadota bacterium]